MELTTGNGKVKYRGLPFEHGDEWLIIPPLPLDASREAQQAFANIKEPISELKDNEGKVIRAAVTGEEGWLDKRFATMKEAIGKAILRNYPDIKDTIGNYVSDFVTMQNVTKAYYAAIGILDEEDKKQSVKSVGEIQPVALTGTSSTGASVAA